MKPINPYIFQSNREIFGQPPGSGSVSRSGQNVGASQKTGFEDKPNNKGSLQINEYVKVMTSLENSIESGSVDRDQTKMILEVFENKFDSLNQRRRENILKSDTYRTLFEGNPMEEKMLSERLTEKIFESEDNRKSVFDMLKSKEFVAMLRDEDQKPNFNPYKNGPIG